MSVDGWGETNRCNLIWVHLLRLANCEPVRDCAYGISYYMFIRVNSMMQEREREGRRYCLIKLSWFTLCTYTIPTILLPETKPWEFFDEFYVNTRLLANWCFSYLIEITTFVAFKCINDTDYLQWKFDMFLHSDAI